MQGIEQRGEIGFAGIALPDKHRQWTQIDVRTRYRPKILHRDLDIRGLQANRAARVFGVLHDNFPYSSGDSFLGGMRILYHIFAMDFNRKR